MTAKSPDEILGLEFDWLATDGDGHVAIFSTAGGGYAPVEFLRDTEAHDLAIGAILALSVSTTVRFAPRLPPGATNTWELAAQRGLFAYDSDAHGAPYRLVAAPKVPAPVKELPVIVAKATGALKFHELKFAERPVLPREALERDRGRV